jgi:hypothetical protein
MFGGWFLVDFLIKGFDSVGKIDEKYIFIHY